MSKFDEILKVYQTINEEICRKNEFNDQKTRKKYKDLFSNMIDDVDIKCDEENNPPTIIDHCVMVARVSWKSTSNKTIYTNLVFGQPEQVENIQRNYKI